MATTIKLGTLSVTSSTVPARLSSVVKDAQSVSDLADTAVIKNYKGKAADFASTFGDRKQLTPTAVLEAAVLKATRAPTTGATVKNTKVTQAGLAKSIQDIFESGGKASNSSDAASISGDAKTLADTLSAADRLYRTTVTSSDGTIHNAVIAADTTAGKLTVLSANVLAD